MLPTMQYLIGTCFGPAFLSVNTINAHPFSTASEAYNYKNKDKPFKIKISNITNDFANSLACCRSLTASLHGGGGPQVGVVTRLRGITRRMCISYFNLTTFT